jgi:hypothetical protein
MQDEPPEEVHPARCLSLPEVRCPEERRPSKEKRYVGRCRGELAEGCTLPDEASRGAIELIRELGTLINSR